MAKESRTPEGKENKLAYIREYNKTTYDIINVRVPKGLRPLYKEFAAAHDMSLAGLVVAAIDDYIEKHQK
jgi:hypothetical protein